MVATEAEDVTNMSHTVGIHCSYFRPYGLRQDTHPPSQQPIVQGMVSQRPKSPVDKGQVPGAQSCPIGLEHAAYHRYYGALLWSSASLAYQAAQLCSAL